MVGLFRKNYLKRGTDKFEKKDWRGAVEELDNAIREDPALAAAYGLRGQAYYFTANPQAALPDLERAIQLGYSNSDTYFVRGRIYGAQQRGNESVADFSAAIRCNPGNDEAYAYRGNAYNIMGKRQESIADLNKAISLNPGVADYYIMRAAPKGASDDKEGALADMEEAVRLGANSAQTYFLRGFAYQNLRYIVHAANDYRKALQMNPNHPQADLMRKYIASIDSTVSPQMARIIETSDRGSQLRQRGDLKGAIQAQTEAIKLDPSFAIAYSNRAVAYADQGNDQAALADLTKAISLKPDYEDALLNRAALYDKKKQYQEALADCQTVIGLYPTLAKARIRQGQIYKSMENYPAAIESCIAAISLDANNAEAFYVRGLCHVLNNEQAEAIADLEKCVALGGKFANLRQMIHALRTDPPADVVDLNRQGIALAEAGNLQGALTVFNEIIVKHPDYSGGYSNRGNVYRLTKQFDAAKNDYGQALHYDPQNTDALFGRGLNYAESPTPDYASAIADLTAMIALRPDLAVAYRYRFMYEMKTQSFPAASRDLQQYIALDPAGYAKEKKNVDEWMGMLKVILAQGAKV